MRITTMEEDELSELLERAIGKALDSRDRLDQQQHQDDHAWVLLQRQREKKWNDLIEKVKLTAVGALTIGIIGILIQGLAFIGALVMAGLAVKGNGNG